MTYEEALAKLLAALRRASQQSLLPQERAAYAAVAATWMRLVEHLDPIRAARRAAVQ